MPKLVYISGALSDLPAGVRDQHLQFYEDLGRAVESIGLEAYVPHLYTDPVRHKTASPALIDRIDRTAVSYSCLVIAVVDYPALGVGIEIEMANHAAKPVLLVCQADRVAQGRISRLARGNPAVQGEILYLDFDDAIQQVLSFLKTFLQEQTAGPLPGPLQVRV